LAAAAPVIINNLLLAAHVNYEGVARAWLKTTVGQTWAADHAAQVALFLSNSLHQHLNALSTMMFNMMRQGAALQNP
jgi:hypothetical protein